MNIGIDLGTTNSLVAVWQDGQARVMPNSLGHSLTPSAVGLDGNGDVLVGMAARERLITHPELTASSFKRYMGTDHEIRLGERSFRPEELSSLVLRSLKGDAEAWLGEEVTEAVISVPAYFNDTQRKATRVAGELAGFKVERLINEPTAAALAYGLQTRGEERSFLVFDLGGGTFDVSVLELFEGVMEVRASGGDNFLGGEDFVERLIEGFLERAGNAIGMNGDDLPLALRRVLHEQAERAKRQLTADDEAVFRIFWDDKDLTWAVDRDDFEAMSRPLLDRLTAPVERALRDARIRPDELDEVVMVGGATRMPIIRKLVARMFGRLPAARVNPDQVVAIGTAVQAGLKARDAALEEVVMTDVCPYSLGTEIVQSFARDDYQDGFFLPIIDRNTTIPASRVHRVWTVHDYQESVVVAIYQGEGRLVKDNVLLGELNLDVPAKTAGEEAIDIRFTYDINGILEVEAVIVSTGELHRTVIERCPGLLTPEEIEERLQALSQLKILPREEGENRAVLARAERLYEERLGELRNFLGEQIAMFETILARQDPREIADARTSFATLLNEIEGDVYF